MFWDLLLVSYITGYFLAVGMCIIDGPRYGDENMSAPVRIVGTAIVALGSWVYVGFSITGNR